MINVSDEWKLAYQQSLVPESYIKIVYGVTDAGIQDDAIATSNNEMPFSETQEVVNADAVNLANYAMLEQNSWVLDGSRNIIPNQNISNTRYVSSDLSNQDGTFTTYPTLTLSFDRIRTNSIPGLVITWNKKYGQYATKFKITSYAGSAELNSTIVENNTSLESIVTIGLSNYDAIKIEILAWSLPYQRARVTFINLGLSKTFTKADLISFEHEQQVDLLSGALPKNSIKFSIDNLNGMWDPNNPTGEAQYLSEQQPMFVQYGLDINGTIEWIEGGIFYLSEWSTPSNGLEVSFDARDCLGFLDKPYLGRRVGTAAQMVIDALTQSDLQIEIDYMLSTILEGTYIDVSTNDTEYKLSDIIQLCANASQCVIWQCRDGILHIERLDETLSDYEIDSYSSYSYPELTVSKELKGVSVNSGLGYSENSVMGEVQTLDNDFIQDVSVANRIAAWIKETLKGRRTISGEYRADPRMDALDKIVVYSKYDTVPVVITDIKYTYQGSFKGNYSGRIVAFDTQTYYYFTNDLFSGEV